MCSTIETKTEDKIETIKLQCIDRAKYSAGDEKTLKYSGQFICVDYAQAPEDTPLVPEGTRHAAVNCRGYLAQTEGEIKGKLQDTDPSRFPCNLDFLKRNGLALQNPYSEKRSTPVNGFLTSLAAAAAYGGASFHCIAKTKDPDDPQKTIGAYALTSWADPGDKKKCSGEHVQAQKAAKKKVGADRGAGDYEILFRRAEDETGKPLCVPVAYDNKGIVILRAKIDCDTPSNEVGMGAALFIMGAIGIAFAIHQKFKAKREKELMEAAEGGSSKKVAQKKRPMKRPAKKTGKSKEKKGGFFGKGKKDTKVKPSETPEDEGTKADGNGDDTTKPEGSDQAKDKTDDAQEEKATGDNGDENTSHDEKSDEKDATHDEKSDEKSDEKNENDNGESSNDESDDDAMIEIENSDDDNTDKEDETQEVEAVDLSMNANLVSPKGTKKKKAVF